MKVRPETRKGRVAAQSLSSVEQVRGAIFLMQTAFISNTFIVCIWLSFRNSIIAGLATS